MKGLKFKARMPIPQKRVTRKSAEKLERKNWHLTQVLGAILFASENPEAGFTISERDVMSVDIKDVELIRGIGLDGKATVTVRIKDITPVTVLKPVEPLTPTEDVAQC